MARSRVCGQEVAHGSSAWGAWLGRVWARNLAERGLTRGIERRTGSHLARLDRDWQVLMIDLLVYHPR
jgi:hypothetical protein